MITIYCVKKPELIAPNVFNKVILQFSSKRRHRIKRFLQRDDAYRAMICEMLARTMICEFNGLVNRDIKFRKNEFGKPFLQKFKNIHFNISHSGDWIVCAINNKPIGIDIEQIKEINYNVAKSVFSKKEYSDLIKKNGKEKLEYFYSLWTLKESYIKSTGKGLSKTLDSFTVNFNNQEIILEDDENKNVFKNIYLKQYHIDNNHKMAICSLNRKQPLNVEILSFENLYNEFLNFI